MGNFRIVKLKSLLQWCLKQKSRSKADVVFYSTSDLLDDEAPEQVIYVPNPVDTAIFRFCLVKSKPKTAFIFLTALMAWLLSMLESTV